MCETIFTVERDADLNTKLRLSYDIKRLPSENNGQKLLFYQWVSNSFLKKRNHTTIIEEVKQQTGH